MPDTEVLHIYNELQSSYEAYEVLLTTSQLIVLCISYAEYYSY